MGAPLLNEYKAKFAFRRYITTLSGGASIPPKDSPAIHSVLVVIYSILFLSYPGIAGVLVYAIQGDLGCVFGTTSNVVYGCIVGMLDLILNSLILFYNESQYMEEIRDQEHSGLIGITSEDEPELMGPPISSAFDYVFNRSIAPSPSVFDKLRRLVKCVVAGIMSSAVLGYLQPSSLQARLGTSSSVWLLYGLCWITFCMAHWPMVAPKPFEFNTYYAEDSLLIDHFTRQVYIAIILILASLESSFPQLHVANTVFYIIFASLPLLWAIGVLPSLGILCVKVIEVVHTLLLGGSATVTTSRLLISFIFFVFPITVTTCACLSKSSTSAALYVAACGGCLNGSLVFLDMLMHFKIMKGSTLLFTLTGDLRIPSKHNPRIVLLQDSLYLFVRIAITALFVFFISSLETQSICDIFSWLVIGILLGVKFTREIQQPYLPSCLPLILNPFEAVTRLHAITWVAGKLHLVLYHILPYASLGWILTSICISTSYSSASFWNAINTSVPYGCFWLSIMLTRCLLVIWNRSEETALDICFVMLVSYCFSQSSTCSDQSAGSAGAFWCSLDVVTRIFVVGQLKNMALRFREKTVFWLLGVKYFLFNRKERHAKWFLWIFPIIFISPISIAIGSILDLPTMAFLGLPLLVVGFPRPVRMWPDNPNEYSSNSDGQLYSAMAPSLMRSISTAISTGKIPPVRPGNVLLARIESRLVLIRGVETWYEGFSTIMSGAELEQTSCHALEGTQVDNVLDLALIGDSNSKRPIFNPNIVHTLNPIGTVTTTSYTESKLVTTGILDNKTYLDMIPAAFFKVLVFNIVRMADLNDIISYRDAPVQRALLQACWKKFPVNWFEYLKNSAKSIGFGQKLARLGSDSDKQVFNEIVMTVCISCYVITMGLNPTTVDSPNLTPASVFEIFKGELGYGIVSETRLWWLNNLRSPLRKICIQSFRQAVKLIYEEATEGEPMEYHHLEEKLETFDSEWLITIMISQALANDPTCPVKQWQAAFENDVPNMFALFKRPDGQFAVRILRKSPGCVVRVGFINGEAVKGIWANLLFELLYLTNDDDERFSIQAHEILLRNLTVQSAAPPFGYPLWSSHARLGRLGMSELEFGNVRHGRGQRKIAPEGFPHISGKRFVNSKIHPR